MALRDITKPKTKGCSRHAHFDAEFKVAEGNSKVTHFQARKMPISQFAMLKQKQFSNLNENIEKIKKENS